SIDLLARKQTLTEARWLRRREPAVRDLDVLRVLGRARVVATRGLVDAVEAPRPVLLELPRRRREDHTRPVAGADEDVAGLRRAVHEVPRLERPLLAFDDQERLAGQPEEVLLLGLPVIRPVRLARC